VIKNAARAAGVRFTSCEVNPDASYEPYMSSDEDGEEQRHLITPEATPKVKRALKPAKSTTIGQKSPQDLDSVAAHIATVTKSRYKRRVSEDYSASISSRSSTSQQSGTRSPLRHVIDGRVVKTYRKPGINGALPTRDDELISELARNNVADEAEAERQMALEKALYQDGDHWADDEEMFFERVFLRQYRPSLPGSWKFAFQGIPAPDRIFGDDLDEAYQPWIYSYSGDEYHGESARLYSRVCSQKLKY